MIQGSIQRNHEGHEVQELLFSGVKYVFVPFASFVVVILISDSLLTSLETT
jgi:hypothetical protein